MKPADLNQSTRSSRARQKGTADQKAEGVYQMLKKPQKFLINIKADLAPVEHEFRMDDEIFTLGEPNPCAASAGGISEACNCCFTNFQSYKESKTW